MKRAPSNESSMLNIEKQANDPLLVLASQEKEVSLTSSLQLQAHSPPHTPHTPLPPTLSNDNIVDIEEHHNGNDNQKHLNQHEHDDHEQQIPQRSNSSRRPQLQKPIRISSSSSSSSHAASGGTLPVIDERCHHDISKQYHDPSSSNSVAIKAFVDNYNAKSTKTEDETSSGITGIMTPKDEDVLSGRGAGINHHPGNVFFRKLISANKETYLKADPGEKKRIIRRIVQRAQNHGRFLKHDQSSELWIVLTFDEAKKKTGQALRENAPAIKKQHKERLKRKYEAFSALSTYVALQQKDQEQGREQRQDQGQSGTKSRSSNSVSPSTSPIALSCNHHQMDCKNEISTGILLSSSSLLSPPAPSPSSPSLSSAASISSNNATHNLLWSRMNMLQDKQEQLKRKQRELEDEQNSLMQCIYQLTAASTLSSSHHATRKHAATATTSTTKAASTQYHHIIKHKDIIPAVPKMTLLGSRTEMMEHLYNIHHGFVTLTPLGSSNKNSNKAQTSSYFLPQHNETDSSDGRHSENVNHGNEEENRNDCNIDSCDDSSSFSDHDHSRRSAFSKLPKKRRRIEDLHHH